MGWGKEEGLEVESIDLGKKDLSLSPSPRFPMTKVGY